MRIENRTVMVTGGASGLGLATVEMIVGAGGRAVIADVNEQAGNSAKSRLGDAVEFVKTDVLIALEHATGMGLDLPSLALAHQLYSSLAADGHGRDGTQALVVEVARRSGFAWP